MPELVTCAVSDGIARVRLSRPEKLNALTLQTLDELVATARSLRRDRTLRAVVLSGAGESFCAGLDFGSVLREPAGIARSFLPRPWRGTNTFQEACWAWRRLPVPVIAAVHGHCYGGGLQIALAADFRFATPDSDWSVLEGRWGIIPDMTGIRTLSELVGIDTAKQLTMTGRKSPARRPTTWAWSPASPPTRRSLRRSWRASWPAAPPTPCPPPRGCSTRPGPPARAAPSPASVSSSCGSCSWPTRGPPGRRRSGTRCRRTGRAHDAEARTPTSR
jgi:hypothetical protein